MEFSAQVNQIQFRIGVFFKLKNIWFTFENKTLHTKNKNQNKTFNDLLLQVRAYCLSIRNTVSYI